MKLTEIVPVEESKAIRLDFSQFQSHPRELADNN
jgi:hypothetical protein